MPTGHKKSPPKTGGTHAHAAAHAHAHPTWVDMIKECIAVHPEDARSGVSRPTIKKFVESKYHIDLTAAAATQLNRAITHGSEKGIFVLPKGASGKVKLAPKGITTHKTEAAKENAKPAPKKPSARAKAIAAKAGAGKKPMARGGMSVRTSKIKAPLKAGRAKGAGTRKPAVKAGTVKRPVVAKAEGRKVVAASKKVSAAKKGEAAKKGVVKKVGAGKKAVVGAKAKPASKGKPVSKTKPASKGKPASKVKA